MGLMGFMRIIDISICGAALKSLPRRAKVRELALGSDVEAFDFA